jgi:hypothetical protein
MSDRCPRVHLLEELGAGARPHSGGTLLGHLLGTRDLLARWTCDEATCQAGLFHSVYATDHYRLALLNEQDRPRLVAVIGARAEELVHLFAIMDRQRFLADATGPVESVLDRRSSQRRHVGPAATNALCHILAANWVEQHERVGTRDREQADAYLPLARHLNSDATRHLTRVASMQPT